MTIAASSSSASVATVRLVLVRFTEEDRPQWLARAQPLLSEGERRRVASTRGLDQRACHAIGRAAVRWLVAAETGCDARAVRISASRTGKPELAKFAGLHVSVSHTGRAVLAGLSLGAALGVDIERPPDGATDLRRVVRRTFAPEEVDSVRNLSDPALAEWFSSAWTVKEAVGKALGLELAACLRGVHLKRGPSEREPSLARVDGGPPASAWTIRQFAAPGGNERIAVALPAQAITLQPVATLLTLSDLAQEGLAQRTTTSEKGPITVAGPPA
jgi:phosphopantetheinyl transferase